ncbi:type IV pilin N-terminal domain-containing protein [Methanoregula sp.]|uniref:type IV pilin N-terminal domain-containing protein n=1 Tax=Methanoregula sp. TaxID=2052170 RepID=UPI002370A638|nr:type IV pilin N-terminal domain-containing protein [Methanoregula sp.]MDD1686699.1 type IV pilin N-terminal domain-containing protein [Methanoregula sp.]
MISKNNDSAVSPVVGVMLMLVVTIIIAAVVSAFAGGMTGSEKKTPQATLSAVVNLGDGIKGVNNTGVGDHFPVGYTCENNYILFAHDGGDSFNLNDIEVSFQNGNTKTTLGPSDKPVTDTTTAYSCRDDPADKTYLEEIGNNADGFIKTGDKFKLTFDANYQNDVYDQTYLILQKEGAKNGFGFPVNKAVQYMIIDRVSGKTINSGEIIANV